MNITLSTKRFINNNFHALIGSIAGAAVTAAVQSFAHGTNDAQKSMGIITITLVSNNLIEPGHIPFWVQLSCAAAMALGTSVGGWRIIKTVGTQVMKIKPVR